jgi:hypothetical protein
MNYSALPFALNLPAHPIVLDVQALSARFQTVTDRRAARDKRYPLPVKENQPTLYTDVETLFDLTMVTFVGGEGATDSHTATRVEPGHGRVTRRTITVGSMLAD